ncbi:MAG: lipocalin family protein [Chitinophagaceae bacterium]
MKKACYLLILLALFTAGIFSSCKKDDQPDPSRPQITLSSDKFTGKSGQELTVAVTVAAPNGIASFVITKGVNLVPDLSFGVNGILTVPGATGNEFTYLFRYTLRPEEVDKLVGFNFRVVDSKGLAAEKDFTLNTTVSGQQLLYSYRWNLKAKVWKTTPPADDLKPCEQDDYYLFNRDGSMMFGYGASACTLDGLNVYTNWSLSADEKELSITYHSLFNPAQVTVDKYQVVSLTRDKLVLSITYDLTVFGLSDHELFEFTYEASPR